MRAGFVVHAEDEVQARDLVVEELRTCRTYHSESREIGLGTDITEVYRELVKET